MARRSASAAIVDPVESAKIAGLRYVSLALPGIRRLRWGKSFRYRGVDGRPLRDAATLERIRRLVIPPAWIDVWICPRADGHIQAVGRDARGRKQYRYHADWNALRNQTKYARLLRFGLALGPLRERTDQDLTLRGLPRARVLATAVRLLETTFIRVGNAEYLKHNNSHGLTTLRDRHVEVDGSTIRFEFRGKSGVAHSIEVEDPRLARIVARIKDIPGYELFQYLDEDGGRQAIDSGDVNAYLREVMGEEFTAKDFRTWAGTVQAAVVLRGLGEFDSVSAARANIVQAIQEVAARLGNRPTTTRKYYVHPAVLEAYVDGSLLAELERRAKRRPRGRQARLAGAEAAVLAVLERAARRPAADLETLLAETLARAKSAAAD